MEWTLYISLRTNEQMSCTFATCRESRANQIKAKRACTEERQCNEMQAFQHSSSWYSFVQVEVRLSKILHVEDGKPGFVEIIRARDFELKRDM